MHVKAGGGASGEGQVGGSGGCIGGSWLSACALEKLREGLDFYLAISYLRELSEVGTPEVPLQL